MRRKLHLPLSAALLLAACTTPPLYGEGLTLPENAPRSQGAMEAGCADPEYDAAAREPSVPGKIRGIDRFVFAKLRKNLAETLAALPEGPEGRGSPWLPKFEALKTGLDKVLASQTQEDCLALIPLIAEVLPKRDGSDAGLSMAAYGMAESGTHLIDAAARYVEEQKGKVSRVNLRRFVMLFSRPGFYGECDWEGERMPIDRAGVMILDPMAVMDYLKTLPPEEAGRFFGNWDLAMAFEDYEEAGKGTPLLKSRYAANRERIRAKWRELEEWVAKHQERTE